jgi:hypothetical protein
MVKPCAYCNNESIAESAVRESSRLLLFIFRLWAHTRSRVLVLLILIVAKVALIVVLHRDGEN